MMLAPRDRIAGVLLIAADDIERHGWCQGTSQIGAARCTAWALTIAAGHDVSLSEQAGYRLMRFLGGRSGWKIPDWNDRVGRTKEEIIEALRAAAFRGAE